MALIGASMEESVSIPCRISADPPNVHFEWTFSSSGERFEVPSGQYTTVQDNGGGANAANDRAGATSNSMYMGQGVSSHTEVNGGWRQMTWPVLTRTITLMVLVILLAGRNVVETVSELVYTPKNERDFGTLACWAKNSIGKQAEPCLFQVVPAG